MKKDIIKVLMHPLRIRIIQELATQGKATTKELLQVCGECSQASLYRHLKDLLEHQLIQVVDENNINGIIEKVYGIQDNLLKVLDIDPANMSKTEYMSLFSQFIISLLTDFNAYFNHEKAMENVIHHIGFSSSSLFLTDEELQALMAEIASIILKRHQNKMAPGRKLRKISHVVTTTLESK